MRRCSRLPLQVSAKPSPSPRSRTFPSTADTSRNSGLCSPASPPSLPASRKREALSVTAKPTPLTVSVPNPTTSSSTALTTLTTPTAASSWSLPSTPSPNSASSPTPPTPNSATAPVPPPTSLLVPVPTPFTVRCGNFCATTPSTRRVSSRNPSSRSNAINTAARSAAPSSATKPSCSSITKVSASAPEKHAKLPSPLSTNATATSANSAPAAHPRLTSTATATVWTPAAFAPTGKSSTSSRLRPNLCRSIRCPSLIRSRRTSWPFIRFLTLATTHSFPRNANPPTTTNSAVASITTSPRATLSTSATSLARVTLSIRCPLPARTSPDFPLAKSIERRISSPPKHIPFQQTSSDSRASHSFAIASFSTSTSTTATPPASAFSTTRPSPPRSGFLPFQLPG